MKNNSIMDFISAFLKESGLPVDNYAVSPLAGDGSKRLFKRIIPEGSKTTFIFMQNPPNNEFLKKENYAYLNIGNHMLSKGLPLPQIIRHDLDKGFFILEDMGDLTLQEEALKGSRRIALYEEVIETLLKLQLKGREDFDTTWCCQTPFYDSTLMREKEAWYFRDAFLRDYTKTDIDLSTLDESFEYIITVAEKADNNYLLYRDFQSRNIMCRDKGIALLDWQGARLGPLAYDLASLIYDPYVDLSGTERNHLIDVYASSLKHINPDAYESFIRYFLYIAVMRLLQALGAYSFLSLKKGKKYFEKYIPVALRSLIYVLDEISDNRLSRLLGVIKEVDFV
ncbi:MAG: phosphotransferase [Deltaproteobacteria bacterium]|nr:phosphotransferase [Deltaproteobacteria bacterium]